MKHQERDRLKNQPLVAYDETLTFGLCFLAGFSFSCRQMDEAFEAEADTLEVKRKLGAAGLPAAREKHGFAAL